MRPCSKKESCRSGPRPRCGGLVLSLMLLLVTQPLWADVSATLGQNTIYEGDTVTLIIETSDRNHDGEPGLAVLQQDFEILGTRNSQQTQIINGRRTDKRQWHVELAPRNSGTITVPAISVGNDKTEPLQLSVKNQPAAVAAGSGQPVFVKAHVETADGSVYVQQQIHYTLRLFYREALAEGSFDGLEIEHALIERLGDDNRFRTTVNGEQYQVLERRYAIFPEQSGKLVIPAVVFNGRMSGEPLQRGRSSDMSSMMNRFFGERMLRGPGKRIRLRSDAITLEVKPRPVSYSGTHWLPSEQLVLNDSWADGPPEFRAGEPVTRTITLEAKGLESSHLPDISMPEATGMRLYPEKPEHTTRTDGEWVYGSTQQSVAYVPTATGRITLPEIRVDWWDTATQQQRSAVIPAWEVNVLAAEGGAGEAPPPVVDEVDQTDVVADVAAGAQQREFAYFWKLLFAALALFLPVLLWIVWRHRSGQVSEEVKSSPVASARQQLKAAADALEKACQQHDSQAAARALLQWAEARWPDEPPRNLGSLVQRLTTGVEEIRGLEQALYAADVANWQGEALWQVFSKGLEAVASESPARQESLSPLYPDWNAR